MLMYVITGPEGDRFLSEDVQVCLANMGEGERVYIVNYEENDRELIARHEKRATVCEETDTIPICGMPGSENPTCRRAEIFNKTKGKDR